LLLATATAFVVTEKAKLELSPIYGTHVTQLFSPTCRCATATAPIDFKLRKPDDLSVWIERAGTRVATLASDRSSRGAIHLAFTGLSADGRVLPNGVYVPVIRLVHAHLTITLPSPIRLDTKRPVVTVPQRIVTHISPDGDGRNDAFRVSYSVNEKAHGILYVDGHEVEYTYREPLRGELVWTGQIGHHAVPPGRYTLAISAQDLAGNRATPVRFATVTVRFIELGRSRVVTRPGARFAILAVTDAPRVTWLLHGSHGVLRRGTLHLRAPTSPGVYRLYVSEAGHAAQATVVVR
jgi:hypothetical protein